MALFTDGPISSLDDLTAQDSQLNSVASAEGVDVTQKMAIAQNELGLDLLTLLDRVRFLNGSASPASEADLASVVVTPALKRWHVYYTLELFYADIYSSQLNDRYGAKRDQFHRLAKQAYERLVQLGIGIASAPVPQASTPTVTAVSGGLPDGAYYVTMAWLNESGDEGASAIPAVIVLSTNGILIQPAAIPSGVSGWNVYVGTAPDTMTLQNGSPINAGDSWQQTFALTTNGRNPGCGQQPSFYKSAARVIQRG